MSEFYPNFKLMKNYHNRYLSKRAFIESSTTYGRWNETLYQVKFYEIDSLTDSFTVNEKALAIANAREFVKRKTNYRMCSLT
ncbi:Uncharacterised protein [Acholeplasma oculi]|uniref:Uncharacterized protein n=1 Tax=Acholeplasma oculi TaxID=35623 RepID=A0A061AH34_9MOLU|nr:hypothetical protein [Acholeplasma oculi]CDR30252.1 hypothetical protein Aocu_01790 [Acholeplasma oculi]SKC43557.1 hypothetical protein SAMN02745122_0992 [Acholeplasma oculi]SUT88659.1 Uncharacterised protein [Acholeplasma oculi]